MRAIYPGSFDPITNGHLDIIYRASKICDELIVAVLNNPSKKSLFDVDERVEMIKKTLNNNKNISVEQFDGLLASYMKEKEANVIIRGLRAVSDYEYELQMALVNKKLNSNIETLFLVSNTEYSFLSSSLVKEIAQFGGNLSEMVPKEIEINLWKKLNGGNINGCNGNY